MFKTCNEKWLPPPSKLRLNTSYLPSFRPQIDYEGWWLSVYFHKCSAICVSHVTLRFLVTKRRSCWLKRGLKYLIKIISLTQWPIAANSVLRRIISMIFQLTFLNSTKVYFKYSWICLIGEFELNRFESARSLWLSWIRISVIIVIIFRW